MACAMCAQETPERQLLFSDRGRICAPCELDLDQADETEAVAWRRIVSPPLSAFTATMTLFGFLVPFIGLVPMIVSPFMSMLAIIQSGRALHTGMTGEVGENERSLLMLSGSVTLMWSLCTLAVGSLIVVYAAWLFSTGQFYLW